MNISQLLQAGANGLGGFVDRFVNPTNSVGQLGNALLQSGGDLGGALGGLHAQKRQQQNDALEQQYRQAQIEGLTAKQNRGQFIQLGNGGVAFGDPDGGQFQVIREPAAEDHRPALQRNFEYLRGLPEDQQRLLRPMMSGFANTEEGQGMAVSRAAAVANAQGQARAAYRAPRTGGMSPYGRSKSNPLPVKSKGEYDSLPVGAWVSPAPGVVFQKR